MRSFNMGRFGSDDPWFRVGTVDVTTTIFVLGAGVLSILVWAVEGPSHPILSRLVFSPAQVLDGHIWRLFTWPLANDLNSIWTLLLFAVFYMLGSQLEAIMGRRTFTIYLVGLTLIPSVLGTLFHLLTGINGGIAGLRMVELGVLVGFCLRIPNARFWPGIPAWMLGTGIVVLDFLQYLGARATFSMFMLLVVVAVSLVSLRSLGFAEEADWVPKIALPAAVTGMTAAPKQSRTTTRRKRRGRANLSVAPAPTNTPRRELSKLEEAEMDAILDQVSERGMDSLTPQQRQRLEDHSKRLRRRE